MKTRVGFIRFSLGIKTHARDEFSHSFIGYQTYEL